MYSRLIPPQENGTLEERGLCTMCNVEWDIFKYSEGRTYKTWWLFGDDNTTDGLSIFVGDFILLRKFKEISLNKCHFLSKYLCH